jgi:long-chain acyl-CoA synthetase
MNNSLEFVTSYFGILRAGLVAVPVNSSYTATEIATVLASAGAKLVVTDRDAAAAVRAAVDQRVAVIEVGTDEWRRLTVGSTPPPTDDTDPESLAVLLYTSGTSGTPKGAMLTHRALLANLEQLASCTRPAPMIATDTALIVLPLFHVYALNAALGLVVRMQATAVLLDRFDVTESLRAVRDHRVTNIAGSPPMYIAYSAVGDIGARLAGVRMLACGAAPLPPSIFEQFRTLGLTIWEGYGMTEASPVISSTVVSGVAKPDSVGHPLPGIDVRVVDGGGEEVDEGDPGELVVRGPNLFSGYWPDGADGPDGDGWFATGDVAIADEYGDLRLVDRRNDLILVSGFNVYPAEIEATLALAPGVAEVAVVGVSHPYSGEAVKAMIVARAGYDISPEDIVKFAQTRLARFKAPTIVEVVSQLPKTVTGKVRKASLREIILPPSRAAQDLVDESATADAHE